MAPTPTPVLLRRASAWSRLRSVTVVDEIALCTLIAAFFVPHLAIARNCTRIALVAALVLVIAWLENVFWFPADTSSVAIEELLVVPARS